MAKPRTGLGSAWPDEKGREALDFVVELEESALPRFAPHVALGARNRQWVDGDQYSRLQGIELQTIGYYEDERNKINLNVLRGKVDFWSSRVLDELPDVYAWPPEAGDAGVADTANAILSYVHERQEIHALGHKAAKCIQYDGLAFYKVIWNPLIGPKSEGYVSVSEITDPLTGATFLDEDLDENGEPIVVGVGEPEGDVQIEVVPLRNIVTDGAESMSKSAWVIERKLIPEWEARTILQDAGHSAKEAQAATQASEVKSEGANPWGEEAEGVLLREFWHRPTPRFPRGKLITVVGNAVAYNGDHPYRHGKLPFVEWKCFERDGTLFAGTHLNDAVNVQMQINALKALVTNRAKRGDDVKALVSKQIKGVWDANDMGLIGLDDPQQAQWARWMEGPGLPQGAREEIEALKAEVDALFNIPAMAQGQIGASTAARAIAFANRLSAMVLAATSLSHQSALKEVATQTIQLYQEKVQARRLIRLRGEAEGPDVVEFMGADLEGVDIRVEPASGVGQYQANAAEQNAQAVAQGAADPELGRTGLQETGFQQAEAEIVLGYVEQLRNGEAVQPDQDVSPAVAVTVLQDAIAREPNAPHAQDLYNLLRWYRSQATGAPEPQKNLQPSPQGPAAQPLEGPGGVPLMG